MYNKLFTKILDSSIWLAPDPCRLVWITLIAAMDEDGNAMFASVRNLAARARVSDEDCAAAIKILESPDHESADPENEGRRVERFPGGWHILNASKYRDMVTRAISRERTRQRVAKHRETKKSNANVTTSNASVTQSEAYTESYTNTESKKKDKSVSPTDDSSELRIFEHWKLVWNHPRAKLDAKRKKVLREALKLYSEADLCLSISGYLNSSFHKGRNDRNTVYDDISVFLRDAKNIDAGIAFAENNQRSDLSAQTKRIIDQTAEWVPPEMRQ